MEDLKIKTPKAVPEPILALVESLAALMACMLLSLVVGLVMALLLISPQYDAVLEISPYRQAPTPVADLLPELQRLGVAQRVESATEGETQTLHIIGLVTRDLDDMRITRALAKAGYRIGEVSIRPTFDTVEILEKVGAPYLTLQALIFLVAGWFLIRFRIRPGEPFRRSDPVSALSLGGAAGVAAFALSVLLALLLDLLGIPVREQDWVVELLKDRGNVVRLVPWIVVLVPIAEEVFFRGYVFRLLSQRAGLIAGYLLSSMMFSAVHLNPSGFIVYMGIGLVMAWVYRRTGSLLAPIAGHVVHNGIVLAIALFGVS